MSSPSYGNKHVIPFKTSMYMKVFDTAGTKPATKEAALAQYNGVRAVHEIVCEADAGSLDGQYFVVGSPTNKCAVYFYITTATEPIVAGIDFFIPVKIVALDTAEVVAEKIEAVIEDSVDDFTVERSSATLTLTAVQGGVTDAAAAGDTGWASVSTTTPGAGVWAKIGKLATDMTLEPSPNEFEDSEGGFTVLDVEYSAEALFVNVTERNKNILNDSFQGENVSIAFMNSDSPDGTIIEIDNMVANFYPAPFGDVNGLKIALKQKFVDPNTSIKYWDYNQVIPTT